MKKYIKYIIVVLVIFVAGIMYSCEGDKETVELVTSSAVTETEHETEHLTGESIGQVCVHVSGYVNAPGVYMLPEGSRVYEAIEQAGDFHPDGDEGFLNLAEILYDGQKIVVLSKEEAATADSSKATDSVKDTESRLVNINTAGKESLMTLPGIGESRAESIIAYREENGGFQTIEDIMKVSGIKEASFNKLKAYICTE